MTCLSISRATIPWQHWLQESLGHRQQAWRAQLHFMQHAVTDWGQTVQDPSWESWFGWLQARGQSSQTLLAQWCQTWAGQQLAQQSLWWETLNGYSQRWQNCTQQALPWWKAWCEPISSASARNHAAFTPSTPPDTLTPPPAPVSVNRVLTPAILPVPVVATPEPARLAAQVQAVVESLALPPVVTSVATSVEANTQNSATSVQAVSSKPARKRTPRTNASRTPRRR